LVDRRGLRVVASHAHGTATAADANLVDARISCVARGGAGHVVLLRVCRVGRRVGVHHSVLDLV